MWDGTIAPIPKHVENRNRKRNKSSYAPNGPSIHTTEIHCQLITSPEARVAHLSIRLIFELNLNNPHTEIKQSSRY